MMISSQTSAISTARSSRAAKETPAPQTEAPAGDQVQLGGGEEVAPGLFRQASMHAAG